MEIRAGSGQKKFRGLEDGAAKSCRRDLQNPSPKCRDGRLRVEFSDPKIILTRRPARTAKT